MLNFFYLTPASISYLNQFLLSVLIIAYLGMRVFVFKAQSLGITTKLLIGFFFNVALFSALLFLEASMLRREHLLFLYPQNAVLGLILLFLLHFAYHFPAAVDAQKLERKLALFFVLAYVFMEAGYAMWRSWLWAGGDSVYRYEFMDVPPALIIMWIIFVLARGSLQNRTSGMWKLAPVMVVPLLLVILNALVSYILAIPISLYHISMSVGILFSLWYFVQAYLSLQPETFPFAVKLAGGILTSSLAVLGSIVWLATPAYAEMFQPNISDFRTIQFTPNDRGGYTVTDAPFFFDTDFGEKIDIGDSSNAQSAKLDFNFPFLGESYDSIYVSTFGTLGIGGEPDFRDYEINFTKTPSIMPLLVALATGEAPGGVYWRKDGESLLITYHRVQGYYQSADRYTFQVRLYANGEFTITYNGLPKTMDFKINDRPESAVWAMGIKPMQAPKGQTDFMNLPASSGPEGMLYDYHLAFREHLHRFIFPLSVSIFVVSFVFLLGVPVNLNYSLARPLRSLLHGVEQIDRGRLGVMVPVQFNDEIGYLTHSFNHLSTELNSLVHELENRVSARTADLVAANEQLLKLSVAVEQSPSSIIITDTQANIEYVNPAFTRATGYSLNEVMGKNPRILKSELTPPDVYREMWEQLSAGDSWRGELVNKKKDGTVFWEYTVIAPIHDPKTGAISHYAAIKEDVTARIQAEHALRDSEEQYRLLFDLETDAIFIIRNDDGFILQANRAAVSLYGYSLRELLSKRNVDLSAEPESTQKATNTPLPSDQVITIPLRYHRKKDGTIFPVEITARFVPWRGQSVHIAAMRDITEHMKIEEELVKLSVTDPLTEVANRRYFYMQAEQIFNRTQTPNTLAVVMVDVDYFKKLNDRYGHAAGDAVLRQMAARLQASLRPTDILARYGGEEFVVLLPRTLPDEAEQVARRLSEAIRFPAFQFDGEEISVTISIGVASSDASTDSLDTLMRHADGALYHAKHGGRNRWVVWGRQSSEKKG